MNIPARTLEDVLETLDQIIDRAQEDESRQGYFPALYRQVTARVHEELQAGSFENRERMRRLVVVFANRYLLEYRRYHQDGDLSRCWSLAFNACQQWWPIVLQHLLLGMNAHINFDLAQATVQVLEQEPMAPLEFENDFLHINRILASMTEGMQDRLSSIWPAFRLLDTVGGVADETIFNFSLTRARQHSWTVANRLLGMNPGERERRVEKLDRHIKGIGRLILHPGLTVSTVNRFVRITETGSVRSKIQTLRSPLDVSASPAGTPAP